METIHVKFNELMAMASECKNSGPSVNCLNFQDSSEEINDIPSQQDLDNLFGPLYDEYYAPITSKVLDNSTANTLDTEDTPSSSSIIVEDSDAPQLVTSSEEPIAQESSNPIHPNEQVISDPSKPVTTRSRLRTDAELCMYALTVSTTEPKNIKEAMPDHSWIESMQDELNQFKCLDVWELVPLPDTDMQSRSENMLQLRGLIETLFSKVLVLVLGMFIFQQMGMSVYCPVLDCRPDISFATCVCTRYLARPTEKHLKEVKRIFCYLRQSINIGLWYSKDSGFELIAYSDADHASVTIIAKVRLKESSKRQAS
ncbi:hypothetical protein Tco_0066939 [Tanacetum coccineum]